MSSLWFIPVALGFDRSPVGFIGLTVLAFISAAAITNVVAICWRMMHFYRQLNRLPTPHTSWSWSQRSREEFQNDSDTLLRRGFAEHSEAIRVNAGGIQIVVISPEFARAINVDEHLSPGRFTEKELYGDVPGLQAFKFASSHRGLMRDVITMRLNKSLGLAVEAVSIEASHALANKWTHSPDVHEVLLSQTVLQIVAQTSLRMFLGPELCRSEACVEIMTGYAVTAMRGVDRLRRFPRMLVPLVHWFIPQLQRSRQLLREARRILRPIYLKRLDAIASNAHSPKPSQAGDSLGWFEELARGSEYDPAVAQLTFAVAAVHATTDFLSQLLIHLAQHPEYVQQLRDEVVSAVRQHGLHTAAFAQMKLMDSVMKESQRLKPISTALMKSESTADIKLTNGLTIPKGSYLAVSSLCMRDPQTYDNPSSFDGYRFLEPEKNAQSRHFSSATFDHMGFGAGKHACPGRFFVALELKVILSHLLLKYDISLVPDRTPTVLRSGFDQIIDPSAVIRVCRRQAELDLDMLGGSSEKAHVRKHV